MAIIRNSFESDTVRYFLDMASTFFTIDQEVPGVHINGNKKRIDAVLYPKNILLKKDFPNIPIGIELKTSELKDGNKKQIIELYHQTIIYRHTRFKLNDVIRFLPLILIYPPSMNYLKNAENVTEEFNRGFRYFAQRLAGLFFIGEIYLPRDMKGIQLMIELCGLEYYKLKNDGNFHKWSSNWGFEIYEREIGKMVQEGKVSVQEYEREVLTIAHRLGI